MSEYREIKKMLEKSIELTQKNIELNKEVLKIQKGFVSIRVLSLIYDVHRRTIGRWCKEWEIEYRWIDKEKCFDFDQFVNRIKKEKPELGDSGNS